MSVTSAEDRKYTIVPYQESWKDDFVAIKNQLSEIFGNSTIEILHVGSTAIKGMSGKPTIDVLVIVDKIKSADRATDAMSAIGYVGLGEYVTSGGRLFAKEIDGERIVNVHCFEAAHPHTQEMIAIRDFFQNNPDKAKEYAELKIDLFQRYPNDYKSYRAFKDPYLTKIKEQIVSSATE